MPRVLKNLLMSALTAALVLGGLELGLRLLGWPAQPLYVDAERPVWRLRPGFHGQVMHGELDRSFGVQVSEQGFRGPAPVAPVVACVGDSTTFGWGVSAQEAWPAVLGQALGVEVLNAGVPGYSSHQGLATLDAVLALQPQVVVVAYLVRDSDPASVADSERVDPGPRRPLQLQRALLSLVGPRGPAAPVGSTVRVPAVEFHQNLLDLVERVQEAGAQAVLLSFPMQEPRVAHQRVLSELRVLEPTLPAAYFFEEDPIHLNVQGNAALAQLLAPGIQAVLAPEAP